MSTSERNLFFKNSAEGSESIKFENETRRITIRPPHTAMAIILDFLVAGTNKNKDPKDRRSPNQACLRWEKIRENSAQKTASKMKTSL